MPTRRFYSLLVLTFVLYLFANQTQVGWLYIIVGLLLSLLMLSRWVNQKSAQTVTFDVKLQDADGELWEGDELTWEVSLASNAGLGAYQYQIEFDNPLIDPEDETGSARWYFPHLPADGVNIVQTHPIYKRGLHRFESATLTTRFPFGLFSRSLEIGEPALLPAALVYPEARRLERFPLLDEKLQQEAVRPKIGSSHEVLSVRPYRQGDSLRHIHWRSVARTGQLISKEFASDADFGVTLWIERHLDLIEPASRGDEAWDHALDRLLRSKESPFETGVKMAASIGAYVLRQKYPLYVADEALHGALSDDLMWTYLARVEPILLLDQDDQRVEPRRIGDGHLIYMMPFPGEAAIEQAIGLKQAKRSLTVILFEPETYPLVTPIGLDPKSYGDALRLNEIDTIVIRSDDNWMEKLHATV